MIRIKIEEIKERRFNDYYLKSKTFNDHLLVKIHPHVSD